MLLFRVLFFGALAFIAGSAIFLGAVTALTSLQNGAITLGYTSGGKAVSETVTRVADGARFWRLVLLMGLLPAAAGAVTLWYAVRKLRQG